jgi:predicted dehydrogenase
MAERCVVVGAGGISGAWFPPLVEEGVEVAAVVDLRLEAAQGRIAEYGLQSEASTDLEAMLAKYRPDFVLDLTLPESHHDVTTAALRAGCHVLGEKPMAANLAEAREMLRVSEETGRLYMVDQSRRWDRHHDCVRRSLAAGSIGDVTTINCDFFLGAHFGGFRDEMEHVLILDMAIHHFDMARFMTGADPVAVYAKEFNPKGSWYRGAPSAMCIFEMTNGVVFGYRGSWCPEGFATSWNGHWRIIGERGTLLYERDEEPRLQVVTGEDGFTRSLVDVPATPSPMQRYTMHGALAEMLTFLRTGEKPMTEGHDNIKSLAMVFAAIESAETGRRVEIATA